MPNRMHIENLLNELEKYRIDLDSEILDTIFEVIEGKLNAVISYCNVYGLTGPGIELKTIIQESGSIIKGLEYARNFIIPELRLKLDDDVEIESEIFCNDIHPVIRCVAYDRYKSKQYADSVEASLKEINVYVKKRVLDQTGNEEDGSKLMKKAFSVEHPIIKLGDIATDTGRNIQIGYMEIFSGSMIGIRNPKAHENINIDANRARHLIYLSSLLMSKLEEEIL
jgi:uncharacterized protein (TIGR02391 family)